VSGLLNRLRALGRPDVGRLREMAREAAGSGGARRARALLERALSADPRSADTYSDLGNVHALLGDDTEAERCYRSAIELAESHPPALTNLGMLHARRGLRDAALDCFRRALRADPWSTHAIQGLAAWAPDDTVPCGDIELLREITARFPDHAAALAALGRLHMRGAFDPVPALDALERALALGQRDPDTLTAHGVALHEVGRLDEALGAFEEAISRDAGHVAARFHRAIALLTLGRFAEAWPDYESRLLSEDRPRRAFPYALWDGEPLTGETVLVYAEQGIGDEILFASCLPELIGQAKRCIIDCAPKLAPIFRRSFPEALVHGGYQTDAVDWALALDIDVQVPIGSLPRHLRASPGAFPRHRGYLRADPARVARWQERLAALGPGRAIGISWRGGTARTRAERRSIRLDQLVPLLHEPGLHFVSLQYGPESGGETERFAAETGLRIHHWPEAIEDYDETAALVTALDGVVSVCTAIVHLAGALGRPAWVATPRVPEWRYGIEGDRMPWYPSVQLVRQRGDAWEPVVDAIVQALKTAFPVEGTHVA
jgi:tetratricopeptide (TPR) repeat protein